MARSDGEAGRIVLVTGAAGFIGSLLTDRLLDSGYSVIGVDNLSRGAERNLALARTNSKFEFHVVDLSNEFEVLNKLVPILKPLSISEVWHLAANSDIPAGIRDAKVDLNDTFLTTFNVLSVMREVKIPMISFASTSAVYGENPGMLHETTGPLLPISNYGAMKLAAEGLISAAVEAYLDRAYIFRFPNVVGPRLTHGIIFDLLSKLNASPNELEVLGNGKQQKPYLHASELIDAMQFIHKNSRQRVNLFNIGPNDEGAKVADIAQEVLAGAGSKLPIRFTGGDRGWVGDVPRFQYSTEKLSQLGWNPSLTSIAAVRLAISEAVESAG